MEKSLVLASNNKGKLREFQAMFAELGVDVINHGGRFGRLRQCLERHARRFVGPLCGRAEQ